MLDLLTRLQKWRNGECGNCKMAIMQIVVDTEDVLTTFEQVLGAARAYREAAAQRNEFEMTTWRNTIVMNALIAERKVNGDGTD